MNPYLGDNSIIVMNNARIHHNNKLVTLIEGLRCHVIFFSSYSPDYNPIETVFSTIKSWIKYNCIFMEIYNDPIYALLVTCSQITP